MSGEEEEEEEEEKKEAKWASSNRRTPGLASSLSIREETII